MRVTYLGPSGTFTHQAVLALRPDAETMPLTTQAEALDAVAAGYADYA
ncbi:MAG: prephenate dehydratase domain-containing protein, partial [Nocardioides sp.]